MTKKFVVVFIAVSVLLGVAPYVLVPPAWAKSTRSSWEQANPMNKARAFFVATELKDGNILVAGGFDGTSNPSFFADSEIYDRHTGSWKLAAAMHVARAAHVAVRLEDGRVLVIGGYTVGFNPLSSAEIYDPSTNMWSLTGSMNDARAEDFTAELLPGHKVLVAGGFGKSGVLKSAEIYGEASGTWTRTSSMNVERAEFATVVLRGEGRDEGNDGDDNRRILVIGGYTNAGPIPTATAEIFDSATEMWTLTGSMNIGRADEAAVRLRDGRILVAGAAVDSVPDATAAAEIFDPDTGQWATTASMTSPRDEVEFAGVLLPDGRVLVPGGFTALDTPVSSADLYDPKSRTWTQAGSMSVSRGGHAVLVLRGDRGVLVMGGLNSPPAATASVDIFHEGEDE
ncbi:Kelch repeat-containing protein [Edaphobacter bradus]|uniref:Kelch repeat-containing protein n=1 Tax=Edaphobacter bradus TaxID=2259016 RepID=UPI0021E0C01D|nr:kelch repeat-containing protein [Edaphobacter bradus]